METKYTPALIGNKKVDPIRFSVPLYQRLFEWQEPEIIQLLKDLKTASEKTPERPYYIGMLTVYNHKDAFDLVDGQQRFTVLMLMGIVFKWTDFLMVGNDVRLSFFARGKDGQYIKTMIEGKTPVEYINVKMQAAITCIMEFVDNLKDKKTDFINYVFNNLTFFISYLPPKYELHNLNRYFEAMNATGRGLENHEILKVNLLRKLIDNNEYYTRIWNAVSDMDKPLLRQRYNVKEKEDITKFHERQNKALSCLDDNQELFKLCNDFDTNLERNTDLKTIKEIEAKTDIPLVQIRSIGERAILNFPEFLLQILWLQLSNDERKESFVFSVHKLQETFEKSLKSENVEFFFKNLLKYRILFDYFIIRISNNDQNSSTYTLAFKEDSAETNDREKLIKYQSMLYVSTSANIWLPEILTYLAFDATKVDAISFYNEIVKFDNVKQKDVNTLSLKYGDIDRYWFWRLDYYLWEKEMQKLKDQNNAILEYSFKANRSIEHLHPQTSAMPWDSDNLNSFGNLAMISPSFNSTQSNDDENVKFARIQNQISGKYLLESIKLLLMYQKAKGIWNLALAQEHGNDMIDILVNSFDDTEEYKNIRDKLLAQKSPQ